MTALCSGPTISWIVASVVILMSGAVGLLIGTLTMRSSDRAWEQRYKRQRCIHGRPVSKDCPDCGQAVRDRGRS